LNRPQRTLTRKTLTRKEEPRYYYDLLKKRFDIDRTIKIQRRDDIDTIANKFLDFSPVYLV